MTLQKLNRISNLKIRIKIHSFSTELLVLSIITLESFVNAVVVEEEHGAINIGFGPLFEKLKLRPGCTSDSSW